MILLVTAYTGMGNRGEDVGDAQGYTHGYTQSYAQSYSQSYSKYFGQARVRTVRLASLPVFPAIL